jgi:hypothetical protein
MDSRSVKKFSPDLRVVNCENLPKVEPDFSEIVKWALEGNEEAGSSVLEVAKNVLREMPEDFDESPSPSSRVAAVFNLLRNTPDLQERLWREIVGENKANHVEELINSHQISFITSRPNLIDDLLRTPNAPESVGLVVNALLVANPNKKSVSQLLAKLDPSSLRFIGEDGISTLRSWAGFDSVSPGDFSDVPRIVAKAVNGIKIRLNAPDEAVESLVNQMLQYPKDAFDSGFKTHSGRPVREFNPELLKQSVDAFLARLRTFQGLDGHPDDSTIRSYKASLPEMPEFNALPPRFKEDVFKGLETGRQEIEQMLRSRQQAEFIGHDCEMLAAKILGQLDAIEGMSCISFVQSRKESDADLHGVDFRIKTRKGVAHVDVKGSYAAEMSGAAERADFSNRRKIAGGIAFLSNEDGSVRIYRFPEQVVVNRSLADYEIAGNIEAAITRALTLPRNSLGH